MQFTRSASVVGAMLASLAALMLLTSPANAAPLDPNAFTSLGTLNLSSGSVTFNTTTLSVSGAFSGTGVLQPQGADLPDIAVFTFDELAIESGVTLNLTGSRPIAFLSKRNAMIDKPININGGVPNFSIGGTARLGGGAGGNGWGNTDPQNGTGPGGGGIGTPLPGDADAYGGGGGGFGGDGGNGGGGPDLFNLAPGGMAYGDLATGLQGGSGGGGGIKWTQFSPNAGGGGGSGGAIEIGALGTVYVALISTQGAAGASANGTSGGGGGGSGGAVLLHGQTVTVAGGILADGGDGGLSNNGAMPSGGGGGGGGGRILVQLEMLSLASVPFPASVSGGQPGANSAPVQPAISGESGIAVLEPVTTIIPTGRLVQVQADGALPSDTAGVPWSLQTDRLRFDAGSIGAALAPVASAHDIELNGGIVAAAFGWTMESASQISGFGQLSGTVAGGATNRVGASGGALTLGDANHNTGFNFAGTVDIASGATLNLLDADEAELGALTTLADGGRLNSLNGIRLGAGEILTGSAAAEIGGKFTNQGTVNGPTAESQFVTFTDDVDGAGSYTGNILFSDGFSPGGSVAAVAMQHATFDSTAELQLRIGGLDAGTEHDVLNVSGIADLGGVLKILLVEGFEPTAGDMFDLINWATRVGTFDTVLLPSLDGGLTWNASQLYAEGILSITLPGDFNFDGTVDAADYVVWRKNDGTQDRYNTWRANFGRTVSGENGAGASRSEFAVPEPFGSALVLLALAIAAPSARRARRRCSTP